MSVICELVLVNEPLVMKPAVRIVRKSPAAVTAIIVPMGVPFGGVVATSQLPSNLASQVLISIFIGLNNINTSKSHCTFQYPMLTRI